VTSGQACLWLSACCWYQWYAEIGQWVTGSLCHPVTFVLACFVAVTVTRMLYATRWKRCYYTASRRLPTTSLILGSVFILHALLNSCRVLRVEPGVSKPRGGDAFCVIGNVGREAEDAATRCVLMRQNAFTAGDPPWIPLGELTALPRTPSCILKKGRGNGKV